MKVRFEPIGEEIECAREETVLDAAFRQGYNLVYGCREGQCSACKCFLLEGEVELKRYSNFALSDSEQANGYSLMCRAMPEQDLVVELLHYDPESYRLEHAIGDGDATVELIEPLTHDIVRLVLRASAAFEFTPGQYVDLHVPGADGVRRSFSMANLPGDRLIELIIRRYAGGRFSGLLEGTLRPGEQLRFTGPYGSMRIREGEAPLLLIAGGSGMAPILSLLRALAAERCSRPVRFFYGARTSGDLFYGEEIAALGALLADFEFVPVVERFVHEAVDEFLGAAAAGFIAPDVYICGPPPMIDAAQELLVGKYKLDEQRIFTDKFTTSADASADAEPEVVAESSSAGSSSSERDFSWFEPARRRATIYEDVTIDTQPSIHRHLTRGWPVSFEDGRGTWDDRSTALTCDDWFRFRDPAQLWERSFYAAGTAIEHQLDGAMRSAAHEGVLADFKPEWIEFLRANLQLPAFVEHGLWFALATIARDCLSDSIATCVCLQAAMKQRSAQAIVLYAMDLERHHGPFPIESARETFLHAEPWQPTRRYVERLASTRDWGEVIVATNLVFEPLLGTLLRRELGIRAAAANGDTVTPVLARAAGQEWEWTRAWTCAFVQLLGAENRPLIERWVREWSALAQEAVEALRTIAPFEPERLRAYADAVLEEAFARPGLTDSVGPSERRRVRPVMAAAPSSPGGGETYDYVGIVMAKSAEGDAVARILGQRDGVEVIEQPAFWDIRAKDRLSISYDELAAALGYEIDAYSIQHEMSTHYGRLIATDDALMLFSDPTDAMEYLMS